MTESACVHCGNCIEVCPTGAPGFNPEFDMREDGTRDESSRTGRRRVRAHCGVLLSDSARAGRRHRERPLTARRPGDRTAVSAARAASAISTYRTGADQSWDGSPSDAAFCASATRPSAHAPTRSSPRSRWRYG
ncbi:4Fe-4S binding protein [Streptomyces sp. NPDC051776]|uniref:4Fe-4S binding protein n=1 Tax=Streptomyces sp. NPDC051776 TaxID=3155414 RepID=UPI003435CFB8